MKVVTNTDDEFVLAASVEELSPLEPPEVDPPPDDPAPTLTTCPTEITTFVYVCPLTLTDGIESWLLAGL